MFGSLGLPEMLFILGLALLIFGPKRLPEFGRTIGRAMGEFRRASTDLRRTLNNELALEEEAPRRPSGAASSPALPDGTIAAPAAAAHSEPRQAGQAPAGGQSQSGAAQSGVAQSGAAQSGGAVEAEAVESAVSDAVLEVEPVPGPASGSPRPDRAGSGSPQPDRADSDRPQPGRADSDRPQPDTP